MTIILTQLAESSTRCAALELELKAATKERAPVEKKELEGQILRLKVEGGNTPVIGILSWI
jgi:hypothetical protein